MSTQQDIYAASLENCPPMLNKDNYVPWYSRLLRYAKSKPNEKLIYNSTINGPYVKRMIPEPGDPDREVPVAKTFHEQTDDELTDKEVKLIDADDQAIQTILMGHPEDIYAAIDNCETANEIWSTSTDGESIESYSHQWKRHITIVRQIKDLHEVDYTQVYDFLKINQDEMLMVEGNGGNQFRQYTGQNVGNQNGYNAVQNVGNQVVQNAVQNLGVQNVGNHNGLIVVIEIANQNVNQNRNGNVVATWAKGDLDEIEEVNANCILIANLQQASTSGTQTYKAPVYDSDGSAKSQEDSSNTSYSSPIYETSSSLTNDSNVISAVSNMEQSRGTVEQNPGTVEETRALYDSIYINLAIEVEKVNTINRKM
ncbi:hypothetical protein Tco_1236835 [Tanacetum coccineum]